MSADHPEPSEAEGDNEQAGRLNKESSDPEAAEWPKAEAANFDGKLYMRADDVEGGSIATTASNGPFSRQGAPAEQFTKLTRLVGQVLHSIANTVTEPTVLLAVPQRSMTIVYGEPVTIGKANQESLPLVHQAGLQLVHILEIEDEDEVRQAVRGLGRGATPYLLLAQFLHAENIDLAWQPSGHRETVITAARAALHVRALSVPPVPITTKLDLDGQLYRAIVEGPNSGKVGIRLSRRSPLPPRRRGGTVVLEYEGSAAIDDAVRHKLLGLRVITRVEVTRFDPALNFLGEKPPYARILEIEAAKSQVLDLVDEDEGDDDGSDDPLLF